LAPLLIGGRAPKAAPTRPAAAPVPSTWGWSWLGDHARQAEAEIAEFPADDPGEEPVLKINIEVPEGLRRYSELSQA
jgi:hypothetical protein